MDLSTSSRRVPTRTRGSRILRQVHRTNLQPTTQADADLMALLSCPFCRGRLDSIEGDLACMTCPRVFRVVDGIPMFADPVGDNDPGAEYKRRQIEFFDREAEEFEISRPHGTPGLYGWLMADKFRRSVRGVEPLLSGAVALTVCGGSGMDAEFLSRQGARVIASDISLGAAQRTRTRAHRYGANILPMVADAEHLPFSDRAVDIAFVHDGLHHLSDPLLGLAEMARVSNRAVCVTEPARAALTTLAVRLGIALKVEAAGNRVERVSSADVTALLREAGFRVVGWHRYAMYYVHTPGIVMQALSRRRLLRAVRAGLNVLNSICGGIGNKLAVQAVRENVD